MCKREKIREGADMPAMGMGSVAGSVPIEAAAAIAVAVSYKIATCSNLFRGGLGCDQPAAAISEEAAANDADRAGFHSAGGES